MTKQRQPPARIESMRIENYRALRSVTLRDLTPLTVLIGPNGSGKSTIFDVFNFLSECFQSGLRSAWERRGRARELKTRGKRGPVVIELGYRERPTSHLITYHLAIDERSGSPFVSEEWLQWKRGSYGRPFRFLEYKNGQGRVISGDSPDATAKRVEVPLRSPDLIAANTLGQLGDHPRVAALRDFITDWYVSYLSVADTRGQPEAGPQQHLSKSGDNLANVIQYLAESHSASLQQLFHTLSERIPRLERVLAETTLDGRVLLRIKDAPFKEPILSRFTSDGTLKMLAKPLGEECRKASGRAQLLVTTHSPFFLSAMRPDEVRVLYRDNKGFTQVRLASHITRVREFMEDGALLGDLWTEGQFGVGDPLTAAGDTTDSTGR